MKRYIFILLAILLIYNLSAQQGVISGDCQNGQGTFNYDEKGATSYTGSWKDGLREGKGKMIYDRNVNESNLPVGPVKENEQAIPFHIKQMRERILADIQEYGQDYLFFFEMQGLNELVERAEKVGEALGYNRKNEVTGEEVAARNYFDISVKIINGTDNLDEDGKNYFLNHTYLNYARNLCDFDVAAGYKNIKDYTAAIQKNNEADQFQKQADDIWLKGKQKLVDDVLSSVPLVSTALDIVKIGIGEDLDGTKINDVNRGLMLFSMVVPDALEKVMKNNPAIKRQVDVIADKMESLTPDCLLDLAKETGEVIDAIDIRKHYAKNCEILAEIYPDKEKQFKWLADHYAKAVSAQTTDIVKNKIINKADEMLHAKKEN